MAKTSSSAMDHSNNYCDDEIIKLELVTDCFRWTI